MVGEIAIRWHFFIRGVKASKYREIANMIRNSERLLQQTDMYHSKILKQKKLPFAERRDKKEGAKGSFV